jgi:hypothetical protein
MTEQGRSHGALSVQRKLSYPHDVLHPASATSDQELPTLAACQLPGGGIEAVEEAVHANGTSNLIGCPAEVYLLAIHC